jgi:hypothetical protein
MFLEVSNWIQSEYSFMSCEAMHVSDCFINGGCRPRRLGAFEVFFMRPNGSGSGPELYLLHSKLMTVRWPTRKDFWPSFQSALPDIVLRVQTLLASQWTQDQVRATIEDARKSGLESWECVQRLASRIRDADDCLQRGNAACKTGDITQLRAAVRQVEEMKWQISEPTMADWREDLKNKNLMLFNIKSYAKRFRSNATFAAAVRLLKAAAVRPFRVETLEKAVQKAYAADIPEEDFEEVAELLSRSSDLHMDLESALEERDLETMAGAMSEAVHFGLGDELLDRCNHEVATLAQDLRRAAEIHDLLELTQAFMSWKMPSQVSGVAWSWPDFAAILQAEAERVKLQGKVDEAEKRYQSANWKALQSSVERLRDVRLEEGTWERWTAALQRELNFTVLKAVSGAGVALKRKLHTNRLQSALRAKSIAVERLEAAADEAASHGVDESLVARARSEASTARQRLRSAEDAAKRKCADVAEVFFWKLRVARVRLEEEAQARRDGPLWAMADAVRRADVAKDWQAMKSAVAGWSEERPGSDHEAFHQEDSPTRLLRHAHERIKALQLAELRDQLNTAVDALGEHAAEPPGSGTLQSQELQRILALLKNMVALGYEVTPMRKARLLCLLALVSAKGGNAGPARFAQATLRALDRSARIVFVLDQSKKVRKDIFEQQLKPALIAVAQAFHTHAKDVSLATVAHGPLKTVQELTSNLDGFTEAVMAQPFEGGKALPGKALKETLKIFKLNFGEVADGGPDPLCFVFNFVCSRPQTMSRTAIRS